MNDPNRARDASPAPHRAPGEERRQPAPAPRLPPAERPEDGGRAFGGAVPDRRRQDEPGIERRERGQTEEQERRDTDRRQRNQPHSGPERRSGQDRRSLMGHAREFATKLREPLIGLGVAAASMPLMHAGANRRETTSPANETSEHAAGSSEATASAARAAAPERDIDAEVGARWSSTERSSTVQAAVDQYGISQDLATQIYDHAREEGVDPKMAYGLVKTESSFRNTAVSHVGARGLTQLMPRTARWLEPGTQPKDLFEPRTSLRVGFRYLRQLIDHYDGNRHLALTAYNRGPGIVARSLKRGQDPDNGYAGTVLRNALRGATGTSQGGGSGSQSGGVDPQGS